MFLRWAPPPIAVDFAVPIAREGTDRIQKLQLLRGLWALRTSIGGLLAANQLLVRTNSGSCFPAQVTRGAEKRALYFEPRISNELALIA